MVLLFEIIVFCIGVLALYNGSKKIRESVKYKENIELQNIALEKRNSDILNNYNQLNTKYNLKQEELSKTQNEISKLVQELHDAKERQREVLENDYKYYIALKNKEKDEYREQIDQDCYKLKTDFDTFKRTLETNKLALNEELNSLKATLNAAAEAYRRNKEQIAQIDYYTLQLDDMLVEDSEKLLSFANTFRMPEVIYKVIWSSYIQKAASAMCTRVLGTEKKTGIYKITNLKTNEVYIGQSVDISERWKTHIKRGLGIDSPQNKLYNNMRKYRVWNFSFELMEECSRERLNEKERFYIDLYQADKYLNSTKGNK